MTFGADAARDGVFWLASYPKSGNTWFRSFLTALMRGGPEVVDINALSSDMIASSRFWIDDVLGFETSDLRHDEVDALRALVYGWRDPLSGPAFHKTHDAYRIAPDRASPFSGGRSLGALYFIRNPLDVASSYAHHNGTDVNAAIAHMADPAHCLSGPTRRLLPQVRQHMGTWSQHVLGWVDNGELACTVLRYEDMHADASNSFARAARFLELSADTDAIESALQASAFDALRAQERDVGFDERPAGMAGFFRQGRAGAWQTELTDAQIRHIISDHAVVMRRFGYLDDRGDPV